jgi:hypothetical protein
MTTIFIIGVLMLVVLLFTLFVELKNQGFFVEVGVFLYSIILFLTGFGNE